MQWERWCFSSHGGPWSCCFWDCHDWQASKLMGQKTKPLKTREPGKTKLVLFSPSALTYVQNRSHDHTANLGLLLCSLRLHWILCDVKLCLEFNLLMYGLAVLREKGEKQRWCWGKCKYRKSSRTGLWYEVYPSWRAGCLASTAPDSRWLLVVGLCSQSSPTSVKWGPAFSSAWKSTWSSVLGER